MGQGHQGQEQFIWHAAMRQYVGVAQSGASKVFLSRGELSYKEGPEGT